MKTGGVRRRHDGGRGRTLCGVDEHDRRPSGAGLSVSVNDRRLFGRNGGHPLPPIERDRNVTT
jgi:hypothetical protein